MKIEIVLSADDMRIIEDAAKKICFSLPRQAVAPILRFGELYVDENGNVRVMRETLEENAR